MLCSTWVRLVLVLDPDLSVSFLFIFLFFFSRFANCVLSQHKPQGEFPLGKYRRVSLLLCRHGKAGFLLQQGKGCSVLPLLTVWV